jgi:murein DD-endopeptidase MepM/ murein hydrolase activator NlpD
MPESRYRRAVVIRAPLVINRATRSRPHYISRVGMGAVLMPPVSAALSSLFGPRVSPTAGASSDHKGIDYAVPVGTPVMAAGSGTVSFAGVQSGFGNVIYIDHGDGTTTIYGHLSQISVSPGQAVGGGDVIGLSGATGTVSGPNLHFQVDVNGTPIDPLTELSVGSSSAPADTLAADLASIWPGDATPAGDVLPATSSIDPLAAGAAAAVAGIALYALFG